MLIKLDTSVLRAIKWHEYATRFALGGLVCVAAGLIAKKFGPAIGGLFLAFPAIFPATATLVEEHEIQRKKEHGISGKKRALDVAAADAIGTSMGSAGMFAFALVFWLLIPRLDLWLALALGLGAWSLVSLSVWLVRKKTRWH